MTAPVDPSEKFAAYAHPERLVSTEWLQEQLDAGAGSPEHVVVESDEDVLLYETGHIPGSVKIDWHTDLNDPVQRDYVDGEGFAALMSRSGITRDSTVVIYGDKNNWWPRSRGRRSCTRVPRPPISPVRRRAGGRPRARRA